VARLPVPTRADASSWRVESVAVLDERAINVGGVPARVYQPAEARGLLLLGHRGTLSKDDSRCIELARRYAAGTGLAVVCIDAPAHGERSPNTGDPREDFEAVVAMATGPQDVTVPDWQSVCDELRTIGEPLAYVGFSMGAMMGIPVAASLRTIGAAVFWAAGLPPASPANGQPSSFIDAAARLGHSEVLMVNTTDDAIFPSDAAFDLFRAITARQKRLSFWPGDHDTEPDEALDMSIAFVNRYTSE
jgi:dienelactone hydrolase